VTVALAFVRSTDGKLEVLDEIIRIIEGQGMHIKCLYLDRAFFTVDIIQYLQLRSIRFLMPAIVRGKTGGTRALIKGRKSYSTLCSMRGQKAKGTVIFPIHAVTTYSKGRQGKNKTDLEKERDELEDTVRRMSRLGGGYSRTPTIRAPP
jgi:putative transposase